MLLVFVIPTKDGAAAADRPQRRTVPVRESEAHRLLDSSFLGMTKTPQHDKNSRNDLTS